MGTKEIRGKKEEEVSGRTKEAKNDGAPVEWRLGNNRFGK